MNARAFVEPPVLETDGVVYRVTTHMYHWCGHPRWGSSVHYIHFPTLPEARAYLRQLGYHPDSKD